MEAWEIEQYAKKAEAAADTVERRLAGGNVRKAQQAAGEATAVLRKVDARLAREGRAGFGPEAATAVLRLARAWTRATADARAAPIATHQRARAYVERLESEFGARKGEQPDEQRMRRGKVLRAVAAAAVIAGTVSIWFWLMLGFTP